MDAVVNAVSVDYLTDPLAVFREICRVLKPGGKAIMSFSNRYFATKVIRAWRTTRDEEHVLIAASYFHYAGGFDAPQAMDISQGHKGDPMYVVFATKAARGGAQV